jgi:hypothetical protein
MCQWLVLVTPVTWEAEISSIMVTGQHRQKSSQEPPSHQKKS